MIGLCTLSLNYHIVSVRVNTGLGIIKMIAPNATSPYNCTPAITHGELRSSGELVIGGGIGTLADTEHRCISGKLDFTLRIDFFSKFILNNI